MKPGKARFALLIVSVAGLAGLATLVGAGIYFKDSFIESWYLHRLDSEVAEEKLEAIAMLGEIQSTRAVPKLVDMTRVDDEFREPAAEALRKIGPPALPRLMLALTDENLTPNGRHNALVMITEIGVNVPETVPRLLRVYNDENAYYVQRALRHLIPDSANLRPQSMIYALERKDALQYGELLHFLAGLLPVAADDAEWPEEVVLPVLIDALNELDPEIRTAAARSLADTARWATITVPPLSRTLADEVPQVRIEAAQTLETLGEAARSSAPALEPLLADPDGMVRQAAASALAAVDLEAILAATRHEQVGARTAAISALGVSSTGRDEEDLAGVVEALVERARDDASDEVRLAAIHALRDLGPEASAATEPLLEIARSSDEVVSDDAIEAFAAAGSDPESVVPRLIEFLRDEDRDRRLQALLSLQGFGADAAPAVDAVASLLDDEGLWQSAAMTLSTIGEAAVDTLIETLAREDAGLRWGAASALGMMGKKGAAAAPALARLARDEVDRVRFAAISALGAAGKPTPAVVEALEAALEDEILQIRALAAITLASLDREAGARAVPILQEVLEGGNMDHETRLEVLEAAKNLSAANAIPLLLLALEDDYLWVQIEAARQLGELGPEGRPVVGEIRRIFEKSADPLRAHLEEALKRIEG